MKHKKINKSLLSTKRIPLRERLIFALDVPGVAPARRLVNLLGDSVQFYKVGLELFMAGDTLKLVGWLREKGKKVFVDLKLFDVPQTVASAVRQLRKYNSEFITVHGNEDMLRAAVREKNGTGILAVTALTSLDDKDMADLGFTYIIPSLVLSRARRAIKLGCDGVISSGLEVIRLRAELGSKFLIVTPGIRPGVNTESSWEKQDDQKRKTTVEQAFLDGADYIVVGRPIREAKDPRVAAEKIQKAIASVFRSPRKR